MRALRSLSAGPRTALAIGSVVLVIAAGVAAAAAAAASVGGRAAGPPAYARDVPLPPGAQLGTGDVTVQCSVKFGALTLAATVHARSTGALPTIVRPGQSLWVTSARGSVTLPVSETNTLYGLGVRKLDVTIQELDLELTGAADSTANAADSNRLSIPPITLQPGQPIAVTSGGAKPLRIGPLATTRAGVAHLALGPTMTSATLITANGGTLGTSVTYCPAPNPSQLLATVRIAGPHGSGSVSVPGQYPDRDVPDDSLVGDTGFQYQCRFQGVGTFPMDGSGTQFGSFGPHGLVFSPGEQLPFQDTQGDLTLTPATVDGIASLVRSRPGGGSASQIHLVMEHVHETAVHLSPALADIIPPHVSGTDAPLRPGAAMRLHFPAAGTLPPFVFRAGAPGIADVWLADEAFTLQPQTAAGAPVGAAIQVSCPTPHPLVPIFPAVVQ